MKIILEELNLPFYDPYLIIQKTEGKLAEDVFRIEIEMRRGWLDWKKMSCELQPITPQQ